MNTCGDNGLNVTFIVEGDYLNNGYPSKSYWLQRRQDKLMDILENGNY